MSKLDELHRKWMKNPKYRKEFEQMKPEFELAQALIEARAEAGLTQKEVAIRMETSQAAIARIESGQSKSSTSTLKRYASAVGKRLRISLEPA